MFRLYEAWASEKQFPEKATYKQYLDIFNNTPGLNIKFFKPKKDQCEICFSYQHKTPEEKLAAAAEFEEHRRKKDVPQNLKRADRLEASKSSEFCAGVFDLQKVQFTPKCEAGVLYYHRKLSNYNFTVYDLGKKEGFCFCWDETVAKRGSNEIGSCSLSFIETKAAAGIKKFTLYADNCAGQNKNRMVYSMFLHASAKYNVEITLRFLVTGHTFNEGDTMHARIETECKHHEMFVPEHYWAKIEECKEDGKPFHVKRVAQNDILDFHDFVNNKSQWKFNENGEEVSFINMEELVFSSESPGIIKYKYNMENPDFQVLNTKARGRGHPVNIATHKFPRAYSSPVPISSKKKDDLLQYCKLGVIPSLYHDFYKSLKTSKNVSETDDFHSYNLRKRN